MAEKKLQLSPEVAERYALKGLAPGRYYVPGFGEVDFTSLTLAQAEDMVKRGYKKLQLKPVKPDKSKKLD